MTLDSHALVFLLSPPLLGVWLVYLRRGEKRVPPLALVGYLLFLTTVVTAAMLFVAHIATAKLPPFELTIVVWAAIGLRLTWEVWARTVGRIGKPARRVRPEHPNVDEAIAAGSPSSERPRAHAARVLLSILRAGLTAVVLVPMLLAMILTHRFKLADGTNPKATLGAAYESVRIPTRAGGELDAWFVPSLPNVGHLGDVSPHTLVICHGAGANKGNFIWYLPALMNHGWNTVLFDFRAHGASSGRVCSYGLNEKDDVIAVVDWLRRERSEQARRIAGLGSSLGAMALARAAAEDERISAVVLDSPFISPRALAERQLARVPVLGPVFADLVLAEMSWLTGADFLHDGAEAAVRAIGPRPVFVIHGEEDVLMPREHSQRLYDRASGRREIWFGPGPHSNIVTTVPDEYAERVFKFLDGGP